MRREVILSESSSARSFDAPLPEFTVAADGQSLTWTDEQGRERYARLGRYVVVRRKKTREGKDLYYQGPRMGDRRPLWTEDLRCVWRTPTLREAQRVARACGGVVRVHEREGVTP